jgi:hypothetical protein
MLRRNSDCVALIMLQKLLFVDRMALRSMHICLLHNYYLSWSHMKFTAWQDNRIVLPLEWTIKYQNQFTFICG